MFGLIVLAVVLFYFASSVKILAEYEKRRDVLYDGLRRIPGVYLARPEGAFYFIARLPVSDADDFARATRCALAQRARQRSADQADAEDDKFVECKA